MANGTSSGPTKADLQDMVDEASQILEDVYVPESSREELVNAVAQAISVLQADTGDEDDTDDDGDDDDDSTDESRTSTAREFRRLMQCASFTGAVSFWRELERLADPELLTRLHAMGVLAELAPSPFAACGGMA